MKLLTLAILAFAAASTARAAPSDDVLGRTAGMARELACVNSPQKAFEVSARVSFAACVVNKTVFVLEDASGSVVAFDARADKNPPLAPGDVIRCSGQIVTVNSRWRQAQILHASLVSRQDPPPLRSVRVSNLSGGQFDYRAVRLTGTVYDARPSETNPDWLLLTITDLSTSVIYASIYARTNDWAFCNGLVGTEITLDGICAPRELGTAARRHVGRTVKAYDISALRVIRPASEGQCDVPDILTLEGTSADDIPLFRQHGAYGKVIAVWDDQAMLETTNNTMVRLQLLAGPKPACGQHIVATGFPETDLYNINLNHVRWNACDDGPEVFPVPSAPIERIPLQPNFLQLHSQYHGRMLKITGRVLASPRGEERSKAYVSTETHLFPVIISDDDGFSPLPVGCQVEITGICIFESERWHPNLVFPKTNGFILVTRTPSDIRIVAHPPWWTVGRLFAVIGTLLAILFGILIWNVSLRHLAARKGRELFKEQLGHVKADLRTEERTRLAVELHDTLAQNLTGVSMEIEAANDLRGNAPKPMLDHLGIAAKALKSCRDELRNCLWDLRSQALEEPDMTTAVLRTLQPHVNDSQLSVRFNVPRARLSDNTAHALLRIIRELVINAIRHGNASTVKVAGTIDQGKLLCSIADNGCGFDPDNAPGILQGHFGLQGIRERIDDLGGEFTLTSRPGKGTRTTITVPIPKETE